MCSLENKLLQYTIDGGANRLDPQECLTKAW